jgi:S1-C subfamily serine protease
MRRLDRRLARLHDLHSEYAVEILAVDPDGPAGRAGMRQGDLIIGIADYEVATLDDLHRFLTEWPAGRPTEITILRGASKEVIEVTPSDMP